MVTIAGTSRWEAKQTRTLEEGSGVQGTLPGPETNPSRKGDISWSPHLKSDFKNGPLKNKMALRKEWLTSFCPLSFARQNENAESL